MPGNKDSGETQASNNAFDMMGDGRTLVESFNFGNDYAGDMRQIWQTTLRDLYSQFERHEYDSWIKNLALVELTQGNAIIAAPTSYARRRLESDYSDMVERALSGVVGQPLSVQFTVDAPVQGHFFEQGSGNGQQAEPPPAPVTGIKRGPYLNFNGRSPNGRTANTQNGSRNSYGSNGNGRNGSNGNGNYGIKSRPPEYGANLEDLKAYNYGEEAPELDDPITGPVGAMQVEQPGEAELPGARFGLNSRYLFNRYIVGSSNRMAAAAGRSVAENPGHSYNPLFIYGGVGLGKTHLLHAIGHEALQLRPYLKVMYVSSEKFTNDLVNSIREQRMTEFRNRYRSIDLLMIDDIQFIAGKESTQEEFFHTFNTLVESNKQVVISSDRSPKSMLTLEDRLRSRFEGGLISDVSLPDYEMRLLILQAKAEYQPVPIPSDVLEFIAHKVPSNIRELEGALIRVVAFGFLNKMAITVELAAQALNDSLLNSRKKLVTKERIVEAVSNFFNVEIKELQGRSRSADIVLPRQVAMYIIREQTDHSLVEIGQMLGGRDHTTVMHGLEKIEQAVESNIQLRQQINTITQIVYNGETMR